MGQSEIRSYDSHVTSCTFEGRSTSPSRSRAREIFTSLKFGNLKIPDRQCHSGLSLGRRRCIKYMISRTNAGGTATELNYRHHLFYPSKRQGRVRTCFLLPPTNAIKSYKLLESVMVGKWYYIPSKIQCLNMREDV